MIKTKLSDLISFNQNTVEDVYTGQETGCRCGCHGKYFKYGTIGATRALNKIRKINPEVLIFESMLEFHKWCNTVHPVDFEDLKEVVAYKLDNWIDVAFPGDRTVTVYFKVGAEKDPCK